MSMRVKVQPCLDRDQRGSALIEFAMISPLVVMFILAALQFGLALRANAGLRELAGWAGREAVVSYQIVGDGVKDDAEIKNMIKGEAAKAKYNLNNGSLNVSVESFSNTSFLTVKEIRLSLIYRHPISVPLMVGKVINFKVNRTYYIPNPATNSL